MTAQDYLSKLGIKARDKITGFEGTIATIGFDLYGCVQAILTPATDKEGKIKDGHWFDFKRLVILDTKPVMDQPDFVQREKFTPASVTGPETRPEISEDPAKR